MKTCFKQSELPNNLLKEFHMSTTSNPSGAHTVAGDTSYAGADLQHRGTDHGDHDIKESKPGFKTSEFLVWLLASALVLIAGAVVDNGEGEGAFSIYRAFQIFGWLSVAYIISRGLAKIGVRHQDR
jgi:hypothetical protein